MIELRTTVKFNHIPAIQAALKPALGAAVKKTAHDVEAAVKAEMRAPKSGRRYRGHQASAPGEAPAVDTGQYINSIQVSMPSELTAMVGTNVDHALPLEFGSRKIASRPVWRPVIEKTRKPFMDAIAAVLRAIK